MKGSVFFVNLKSLVSVYCKPEVIKKMASGLGQRACKDQRRILDDATRMRRARKALESLESDNFHDDPHADLVTKMFYSSRPGEIYAQVDFYAILS